MKPNWVKDFQNEKGELPPVPQYLIPGFARCGRLVDKETQMITPSGQFWGNLTPTQKQQWREIAEWLGEDPEDYLHHMRAMLPKDPHGKQPPNPHLLD